MRRYAEQAVLVGRPPAPGRRFPVVIPLPTAGTEVLDTPQQNADLARDRTGQPALAHPAGAARLRQGAADPAAKRRPDREAAALNSLAIVLSGQQRFDEALGFMRDALAIHQTLGEWQFAGLTLNNIGHVLVSLRRYAEALHYLTQALDIQRAAGDSTGPAPSRTHWVMPAAAWAGSRTRSGITSGRWPRCRAYTEITLRTRTPSMA